MKKKTFFRSPSSYTIDKKYGTKINLEELGKLAALESFKEIPSLVHAFNSGLLNMHIGQYYQA